MTRRFSQWLKDKWKPPDEKNLTQAYQIVFSTPHGRLLLDHWLSEVYCTVSLTSDHVDLATLNGQRAFLHIILEKIDEAENPKKYEVKTEDDSV